MTIGDCKDRSLAALGRRRIEWADENMPVLRAIREEWAATRPLAGVRVAACMHVTTETANLMRTLQAAGAEVALCASNPLSTQDDVAAALNEEYGIATYAIKGEDNATYYDHIRAVLDTKPHITMDDGADLVTTLYRERRELLPGVVGGTEETTTGVIRLQAMARDGELPFPVVAVNNARTKHMFDNRYGTGQSTIDGILRATNVMLAGAKFVVVGFGWCGRGIAARARGMGADVIVVEVDPLRALEAAMEGYRVMPMTEAAKEGQIFVTATGNRAVIDGRHIALMRDGAILANAGHFDVEINIPALAAMSKERRPVRPHVEEFVLEDGRRIRLLAEGRLVNLAAAEGHPAQVMDMSFANQALSVRWLLENKGRLERQVYPVPEAIDAEVARRKLESMGVRLERLTPEQEEYLNTWRLGT
ncbi:MAG: adenosylhomocysteinase [Limnochordales bacterium]|nr:adenosylhomocysteinase [Bacillota bacterium]